MKKHVFLAGLMGAFLLAGSVTNNAKALPQKNTKTDASEVSSATISRAQLLTLKQVNAGLGEYFAYDGLKFTVNSFTFAYVPKAGGQPLMEQVEGNKLTQRILNKIHNAHAGDLIVVTNVDVTGPTGKMVLTGKTLTVR